MKLHLHHPSGILTGLSCRLQLLGHEIVEGTLGNEHDVCIKESEEVPQGIVNTLGYKTVSVKPDHFISKFWTATSWGKEELVVFPLTGLFPSSLGPQTPNGAAAKRVQCASKERMFSKPGLEEFLKLTRHVGFVSFGMTKEEIVSLHLGIPGFGVYCFAQMAGAGSLVDHFCIDNGLRNSWMVALAVSRWPFPDRRPVKETFVQVPPCSFEHFWPWCRAQDFVQNSFKTRDTMIGVATAFGRTLEQALWFAEMNCRKVEVPEKMFLEGGLRELEARVEKTLTYLG